MLFVDIVVSAASLWLALALVQIDDLDPQNVAFLALCACCAAVLSSHLMGIYRSMIRFIGVDFLPSVLGMVGFSAFLLLPALAYNLSAPEAVRVVIVYSNLLIVSILATRFSARLLLNKRSANRERVIVYGAGKGGLRVASSLLGSQQFIPVAFVDDDPRLVGRRVAGLEVFDARLLTKLIADLNARRVLLALPSVSRSRRRQILNNLSHLEVRVQTIPDISDIVSGAARIDDIQDVSVEDLLGRDPVPPKQVLLRQENTGKVVLVTGAGGSIGSELSRKLLEVGPRVLLIVERSEIALYNLDKSLSKSIKQGKLPVKLVAMLGDCRDQARMFEIMSTYRVDTVYHAAAYKHVPIVEHNVIEGVSNNVLGTHTAALAAVEANVSTFVLVSTDKAVSPTNVMGASKRLSEMILQNLDKKSRTRFCMVRFGNVLASSGSVVPLFREQIRSGGPVTVTHPEIIRYFMTIPEAAQLVIQAGAMATGGDVFVLDMGKPVRIVDLATKMIQLMGKTVKSPDNPHGEIEIAFTGLRPAEKLYEELLIGSDVSGTSHPRILRADERSLGDEQLERVLDQIRVAIRDRSWEDLRAILLSAVEGYRPTGEIEDHIYTTLVARSGETNITDLDRYR
ncbi:MAG: nucleoside-diphosphate sugar epimerase/dehydratase [Pseudomonadota bacterium]